MEIVKNVDTSKNDVSPKPILLVVCAMAFGFVMSFVTTSIRRYGGFNYSGHPTVLSDAIVEAIGASLLLPAVHLLISSAFKSKRNARSRRNILIGWGLSIGVFQILICWQLVSVRGNNESAAATHKTITQEPAHTTVADPDQSMDGTYCDRLAAVGASLVRGRNKGTRRSTVETAITNTAEISESERVMYRQMTKAVYDNPSITEAQMIEYTHKACERSIAELTRN